jgi:hypothetical protein
MSYASLNKKKMIENVCLDLEIIGADNLCLLFWRIDLKHKKISSAILRPSYTKTVPLVMFA